MKSLKFDVTCAICLVALMMMSFPVWAANEVADLSSDHEIGKRSNDNVVSVSWDGSGIDGLDGYGTAWDQASDTIPVTKNLPAGTSQMSSEELSDGSWYFHIRPSLDVLPFWGDTSHIGPFIIVTAPVIDSWSRETSQPGQSVSISGFNLNMGMSVYFIQDESVVGSGENVIPSQDNTQASFTVPDDLAPGTYVLRVQNTDGKKGDKAGFEVETDRLLDVDGDGNSDALTDGLLILRYMFGFRGEDLISGAVSPSATRVSSADIEDFLANAMDSLDIDGNNNSDALTDGLLILCYLAGFRGNDLISGAVSPDASRTTADEIADYIQSII